MPLILPGSLAFDGSGNLYFTETGRQVVRQLTAAGVLLTVAGTGTQGFAGDGGPATLAQLDSPGALAIDAAQQVFFADTHNRSIRRVSGNGVIATYVSGVDATALVFDGTGSLVYADAGMHQVLRIDQTSGLRTVLAGSGTQGFGGDGGVGTAAQIDGVSGLAFDGSGNLYLSDTRNQRVRRVDSVSGLMTTVAGTGQPGFSGDSAAANTARLAMPRGVSLDALGNLYIADAGNQRVRRVDGVTGVMTTVVGSGAQAALGDGSAPASAGLDLPAAAMMSPVGLMTIADTGNGRLQQVNALGVMGTIAGVGTTPATLAMMPTTDNLAFGAGQTLVSTVAAQGSVPTGMISLLDGGNPIATALLSAGSATFSIAGLSSGAHTLTSRYPGDASHAASMSAPLVINVSGASTADFSIAATSATAVTTATGNTVNFTFMVTPTGAALTSPIELSVSGLPFGATPTFTPAYVPPPNAPSAVSLAVTTSALAGAVLPRTVGLALCVLLPFALRRKRRKVALVGALFLVGCGDRTGPTANAAKAATVYNLIVSASATTPTGGTLLHTVPLTLTLQ